MKNVFDRPILSVQAINMEIYKRFIYLNISVYACKYICEHASCVSI